MHLNNIIILLFCLAINCFACLDEEVKSITSDFPNREEMPHPCLLLKEGEEEKIKQNIQNSLELKRVSEKVFIQANKCVNTPPSEYVLTGTRLLYVSRQVLQNLYSLSYAYRMSKMDLYLNRAISELNAVCAFKDWHPSHYLDVGEMTMGVAIAYDWLYQYLPEETRLLVEKSIEEKAFDTALDKEYDSFYNGSGNWNQVCNAGLVFGALAIYDKAPEKAQKIIDKCYATIPRALDAYKPDGTYGEGFMYWDYGTSFQAMLNCALETVGMTTFADANAFEKSAEYYFHMVGPSRKCFNYSDCSEKVSTSTAMFYFAAKKQDPSLLYWEMEHIKNNLETNRLLPSVLVYTKDLDISSIPIPVKKTYFGVGLTPVYLTRSAWGDNNAAFFGVKGGKPDTSHGHMDIGSFVYEVNGVRWSVDLGNANYESVEAKTKDFWTMTQNSNRWRLGRYATTSHSTFFINNSPQKVDGAAVFTETFDEKGQRGAELDLKDTYSYNAVSGSKFSLNKFKRRIYLSDDRSLTIVDTLRADEGSASAQWRMITNAAVTMDKDKKEFLLTQDTKQLRVWVEYVGLNPEAKSTTINANTSLGENAITPAATAIIYQISIPKKDVVLKVHLEPKQ